MNIKYSSSSNASKEPIVEPAVASFKPSLYDSVSYVRNEAPEKLSSKPEIISPLDPYSITSPIAISPIPLLPEGLKEPNIKPATTSFTRLLSDSISHVEHEVPKELHSKPGVADYLPWSDDAAFYPKSKVLKESSSKPATTSITPLLSDSVSYVESEDPKELGSKPGITSYNELKKHYSKKPAVTRFNPPLRSPALYPRSMVLKEPDSKPAETMNSPYQASMVTKVFSGKPGLNDSRISYSKSEVEYTGSKMSKKGSNEAVGTSSNPVIVLSDDSSCDEEFDEMLETEFDNQGKLPFLTCPLLSEPSR